MTVLSHQYLILPHLDKQPPTYTHLKEGATDLPPFGTQLT